MVKHMEELLSVWHRQIELVLTESEQVRREADDVGPGAELQYWKSRMAKFNWWAFSCYVIKKQSDGGSGWSLELKIIKRETSGKLKKKN